MHITWLLGRPLEMTPSTAFAVVHETRAASTEPRGVQERMRGLFDYGLSSKAIARELDARGIRTQGGSTWYPSIVFDTLRRAGIAPPQRAGQQGLKDPKSRKLGQVLQRHVSPRWPRRIVGASCQSYAGCAVVN